MRVYLWVPDNNSDGVNIGLNTRDEVNIRDMNELANKLKSLKASIERGPLKISVVLDARKNVKFDYVIGALDACYRAEIEDVKFQAPPVPEGGGDDWWY